MKYLLYRLKKDEMDDASRIKIDYASVDISDDDKIIVFVSESLNILGTYKKAGEDLVVEKSSKKNISLKEFYDKLSIITEVGPRTYKVFAKKIKEISEKDYEEIIKNF